ncbi:hypothetical protein [Streptococcus sanguinis]|uniref:hypothetical protein n=1 Tax=Streptococcus sanguinis TaxID=1305 RepID=UPI001CBB179F|nr:hypothetical protein [Streptococcus sanguinis]MBZ2021109.1 hypothetical protein [Streptococcus sanguinis]MCC3165352.1 hypothetical protein [Streptococcus sanguinis]
MHIFKKNKLILLLLASVFAIPYLAYQGYVAYYIAPYYKITLKKKIQSYQFIENNNALVMKWSYENPLDYWITTKEAYNSISSPIVGQKKIVQEYSKLKTMFNGHNIPEGQEYWGITVYNVEGGKLTSKDYDIFKMVRDYNQDFVPREIGDQIYISNDKEILDIYLKNSNDDVRGSIVKSIDLNSGKIIEQADEKDKILSERFDDTLSALSLEPNYINIKRRIELSKEGKLAEDTLIRQKYPEAAKLLEDDEGMVALLTDKPSFESALPILQLLYKKGTNLFENVTIPDYNSVDGQEHVVNSQEEFVKYYKFEQESPSKK